MFSIRGEDSIIAPEDSGLVNGLIATNGWLHDIAEIRGLYAPPWFSDDFKLKIRFNGKTVHALKNLWEPDRLTRKGNADGWSFKSQMLLAPEQRGIILRMEMVNHAHEKRVPQIQYEVIGGLGKQEHWGFGKPQGCPFSVQKFENGVFSLNSGTARILVGSSLKLRPKLPICTGVLDTEKIPEIAPGGKLVFHTLLAVGGEPEVSRLMKSLRNDPEKGCAGSRTHWRKRVDKLFSVMPSFRSDNKRLEKLYRRSILHLLLNEWNVPEFRLHPYYGTGSINGGCLCCYLWNYGEPYRLWSLLNPQSAKEHLKTYLALDLANCYAFFPEDGSACGPYYPVNQEKVIFLTHAYVMQTGDTAFLREKVNGKTVLELTVEQALMHDDLSQKAVLADYGDGNHHLELRRGLRYDGIAPDLNLRRCVNYRLTDELCRLAGYDPGVDLVRRAESLKKLIHKKLYSAEDGWFYAIDPRGKKYLRWTLQMFKALGWHDWAMEPGAEQALLKHLLDRDEFLGDFGIHSLSKLDPAYDERDVDNGGPGACISFAPAIADRLYRGGCAAAGDEILKRLMWLGESLPYWGDSQRADIPEYRRDTPLQSDIQGAALVQTILFGVFGICVREDFSVEIKPHLPGDTKRMELKNMRLAGMCFDVKCTERGTRISIDGKQYEMQPGDRWILPAVIPPGGNAS